MRHLSILLLLLVSLKAEAQEIGVNLGFEMPGPDSTLAGWAFRSQAFYQAERVSVGTHTGGGALRLRSRSSANDTTFGAVSQRMSAVPWRGKTLVLDGWLRTDSLAPAASAALWIRLEREPGSLTYFDNMIGRRRPYPSWTRVRLVAPVAPDAGTIVFGVLLDGRGVVSLDDVTLRFLDASNVQRSGSPGDVTAYVDSALALMEQYSIVRNRISWADLRARTYLRAEGAQSTGEAHDAIAAAVRDLNDNHSFFLTSAPGAGTPVTMNSQATADTVDLGRSRAGYLRIGSVEAVDLVGTRRLAESIQARIARLDRAGACGWIVDLRGNAGGNMWPMLAGLGPLLGDTPVGMFLSRDGKRSVWRYRDGAMWLDQLRQTSVGQAIRKVRAASAPMAVLYGNVTASAGEAVALALRGRDETRSFGSPTAGRVTANTPFLLPDGAILVLATDEMADRFGKALTGPLVPDQLVDRVASEPAGQDPVFSAALEWLEQQPGCGRPKGH